MEVAKSSGVDRPGDSPSRSRHSEGVYIYSVPVSVLLGLQYLIPVMLPLLHVPLKVFPWLCLLPDELERGQIIAKILFLSGTATICQSLFGARSSTMITPSVLFAFATIEIFKTNYWERFNDGELYAMGPTLRDENYLVRRSELQGFLIASSFGISVMIGLLLYFKIKLPTATISSTLISSSVLNIIQQMPQAKNLDPKKSSLALLSFGIMLMFFIIHEVKISFLKVLTSKDYKLNLRVFNFFGAQFSFLICVIINIIFDLDFEEFLGRTFEPHSWLSYKFIPQDFSLPTISLRTWLLFPTFLSQILTSYCCYGLLHKNQDKQMKAVLCEAVINIFTPLFGLFLPLAVEPASVGLWCFTEIKNNETAVISGSVLVMMAAFLQVVGLCSFVPYSLIFGISAFAYGQIILKALELKDAIDLKIITVSSLSGLVIYQLSPDFCGDYFYDSLLIFLKSPVLTTFCFSLLLRVSHYFAKKNDL